MKIDISHLMPEARRISTERHNQKKNFKSCKQLSPNYELVGVLGEMVYSIITGENMDKELRISGDNGYDFKYQVNIKTSEEYKAKHLIEFTDKDFKGIYVFICVNLQNETAFIKGMISSEMFLRIKEDMDFGYGPRYAISLNKLSAFDYNLIKKHYKRFI